MSREWDYPPGSPHPADDVEPLTVDCPTCRQGEGERCLNPISGIPSRISCVARIRLAGA